MGLLTLLCLTDLLLSVICSVQHAPLTYKYYGGLFTLLHYLISAMVTLYCLYSCLYFNLVMFLVFLERQKTVYRSVRKTRTISSTVIYCCSGWQKAYSSSRECREGTFQRLLLQYGHFDVLSFTICEQNCAPSGSFQRGCFYLWCLLSFATSLLS